MSVIREKYIQKYVSLRFIVLDSPEGNILIDNWSQYRVINLITVGGGWQTNCFLLDATLQQYITTSFICELEDINQI